MDAERTEPPTGERESPTRVLLGGAELIRPTRVVDAPAAGATSVRPE